MRLPQLLEEARACRVCDAELPEGARPLVQGAASSRIVIIGQAPGAAAHRSGTPWDDASGRRLREWLGLTDAQFYDARLVALVPMGFCYPGKGASGDMAPRAECAPLWHERLLRGMRRIELTVLIGRYALERYIDGAYGSITDAARAHAALLPERIALPHPSPRNNIWLKKHPWFGAEALPALRERVAQLVG
ncbi:MAG: uracil-DNA glycosylase family protein [Phycisphaerales bacterium]